MLDEAFVSLTACNTDCYEPIERLLKFYCDQTRLMPLVILYISCRKQNEKYYLILAMNYLNITYAYLT